MSRSATSTSQTSTRIRWRSRSARMLGWFAVVAVGVTAPLAVRVVWEGRAELEAADRARAEGDVELAIEHLGRAARWRMPVADHDERGLALLVEIGTGAEERGEDGRSEALLAYREARSALLATRTWNVPDPDTFALVNGRIARLMAEQEEEFGTDVGGTGDPRLYHLSLLEEVPGPDPLRATVAALAFIGWLLATAGWVLRSIDGRGHLRPRPAVRWGVASLVLLVAWLVALRYASG